MKHAMILAAGRGTRMRPLTDEMPKPMLKVGGKPLIQWHIEAFATAGVKHIVINHCWLGHLIEQGLGDGSQFGVSIEYSVEETALETAGGIAKARSLLGDQPFAVINGDIYTDWNRNQVSEIASAWRPGQLAYLVLVPNPPHHPKGDFCLGEQGQVGDENIGPRFTFSGIGVYSPQLFQGVEAGQSVQLAQLLRQAMAKQAVYGQIHSGCWEDVGTPDRLNALNKELSNTTINNAS